MSEGRLRFAIDTGGTFTDLVVGEPDGSLSLHKTATAPSDAVAGVINSLAAAAAAAGETLSEYLARGEILVHGTTHAINAIVTRSTARTAFLTTKGHPDTLVWREGGRAEAFDFKTPYPEPYIPKALTFEIPERVMADGSVRAPLDEAATVAILKRLSRITRRGGRGLPVVVDRQPGPRGDRRPPDRAAPAGRSLHALPSHQSVDPRIPARHVDLHRRIAEAGNECLF